MAEDVKKELVEKVKALYENYDNEKDIRGKLISLKKGFRVSYDEMSFYEQELQDEFDSYVKKIEEKLNLGKENAESIKNSIIEKAEELKNSNEFKKASAKMKDLFTQWKDAGSVGKEKDDELWNKFQTIRDEFYTNRQTYFDNQAKAREDNEKSKLELIEEAVKANEMTNIKDLTKVMTDLMNKWKNVKSAGKEKDDELWAKFLEQRKAFFTKRDSYFESMKAVYAERVEKKKDIIAKAKRNLAISEFTKDEVAAMEELRKAWKEVGSAGKENEDSLWQEFSTIMKKYFDNKKYYE